MVRDAAAERDLWNERYKDEWRGRDGPSTFLSKHARLLPREGRALDVACGTGQDTFFMASCGLDTTGVDISDVAIAIARQNVKDGVPVSFEVADVFDFMHRVQSNAYDVIACLNFFELALVGELKRALKPGGTIIVQAFTTGDVKLKDSRIKDVLVTGTTFFEPTMFGGYWILVHEIESYTDDKGLARQRLNMFARKPFT